MTDKEEPIGERIARVEGILDELRSRLTDTREEMRAGLNDVRHEITYEITKVEEHIGKVEERLGKVEERLESRFFWLLGTSIAMWATIIVAIIFGG